MSQRHGKQVVLSDAQRVAHFVNSGVMDIDAIAKRTDLPFRIVEQHFEVLTRPPTEHRSQATGDPTYAGG